jgi:hypothetical protein
MTAVVETHGYMSSRRTPIGSERSMTGGTVGDRKAGDALELALSELSPGHRRVEIKTKVPGSVLREPVVGRRHPDFPEIDRGQPFRVAWDPVAAGTVWVKLAHTQPLHLLPRVRCTFEGTAGEGVVPPAALRDLPEGEGQLVVYHAVREALAADDADMLIEGPVLPAKLEAGERPRVWNHPPPETWWPVSIR